MKIKNTKKDSNSIEFYNYIEIDKIIFNKKNR